MIAAAAVPADPFFRRELRGIGLGVARAAAVGIALTLVITYLHLLPNLAESVVSQARAGSSDGDDAALAELLGRTQVVLTVLSSAAWVAAGAFVLRRRSHDLFGILVFLAFVSLGVLADPTEIYSVRSDSWAPLPAAALLTANALVFLLAYSFPDGQFVPRWTGLVAALAGLWPVYRFVTTGFDSPRIDPAALVVGLLIVVGVLPAWLYRYIKRADAVQREQMRWVIYGLAVFLAAWVADTLVHNAFAASLSGSGGFAIKLAAALAHALASIVLISTMVIAMFRQGLLDIDLVINRTSLYAVITAFLVAVFVLVDTLGPRFIPPLARLPIELVALGLAALVAGVFTAVRARLFAIADRFVADRRVLTFLFLDMTASTTKTAELGDRSWRDLLNKFRAAVRGLLRRFGGREIDTAGDGFFAVFESPGQAIRCARRIVDEVRPLGVELRVGLHVGECELQGSSVIGIGVVIAQRVMSAAPPNEIFVSRTLRDLMAGSDIRFTERGTSILKGVPGEWQLYAVGTA